MMTSMTRAEVEKIVAEARAENKTPNLRGANLRFANLCGADLQAADFQGANLRFAELQGANLRCCKRNDPLEDLKPQGGDA
ncbi:pentapeptide repeat-containing protein [Corynebacterium diphtheriae]|nr:pentapeptide repeat-containing protein [Corynebacterium diphtheriae]